MVRSGLSSGVVSARLRSVPCVHFDLSVAALERMKQQGLAPSVLIAMIEAQQRQDEADKAAGAIAAPPPRPALWSASAIDRAGRRALLSVEAWDADGKELFRNNGVWVSPDGLILSFGAIDAGVHSMRVRSAEGDTFDQVAVVETDSRRSLSVLRVNTSGMPALTIASAAAIPEGLSVAVIGAMPDAAELLNGITEPPVDASQVAGAGSGYRLIPLRIDDRQSAEVRIAAPTAGRPVLNQQGELIAIVSPYLWHGGIVAVPLQEFRALLRNRLGRMLTPAPSGVAAAVPAPSPIDPLKRMRQAHSVYIWDRTRSGLDARAEDELLKKRRWIVVNDPQSADLWLEITATGSGWQRSESLNVYDRQSHALLWSRNGHIVPMRRSAIRRLVDQLVEAAPKP